MRRGPARTTEPQYRESRPERAALSRAMVAGYLIASSKSPLAGQTPPFRIKHFVMGNVCSWWLGLVLVGCGGGGDANPSGGSQSSGTSLAGTWDVIGTGTTGYQ